MSGNIEQQIGYLTGVLEEIRADVKAMPGELGKMRGEFHQHMSDDRKSFSQINERIDDLQEFQKKQKWTIGVLVALFGAVTSAAAFAQKLGLI